jgi:phosphoribosylanthranilate isomerase
MTKIKICGVTNLKDLETVTTFNIHAIGFISISSSPRNISLEKAKTLVDKTPLFTKSVLVIAPRNLDEALKMYDYVKPDAVQVHSENIDFNELSMVRPHIKVIKPISINNSDYKKTTFNDLNIGDAVLLDSSTSTKLGGTGKVHNWEISRQIAEIIRPKPLILAGGLNPDNVAKAIQSVRPYAVDVCTGTEVRPGVKDTEKVKKFVFSVIETDRRNQV